MDLEFTDDQEELRDSVRSFLQKECPVDVVRAVVETGEPPEKLWGSMVALDWPALAIPEEFGGIGLSFIETAVVAEELGRVVAPGPLLATATQFAPIVREVGSAEQQQRFLARVATGAITGTMPWPTTRAGWSLADVTTRAEKVRRRVGPARHASTASWRRRTSTEVAVLARVGEGFGAFVVPGAECSPHAGALA